jgi:tellurite resistance protein
VLAAAAREVTVLPFRFGAIYRSDDQIHALLRERNDFASTLTRLEGMVEFGLKTFVNVSGLRSRLAADRDVSEDVPAGRAYMERKKSARELEEAVDQFASECARATHERLAAVARDARLNALREQEDDQTSRRLVLNAAYLVARADGPTLEREIRILARRYSFDAVEYELTGPWPPYNFTDEVDRP